MFATRVIWRIQWRLNHKYKASTSQLIRSDFSNCLFTPSKGQSKVLLITWPFDILVTDYSATRTPSSSISGCHPLPKGGPIVCVGGGYSSADVQLVYPSAPANRWLHCVCGEEVYSSADVQLVYPSAPANRAGIK